MKLTATEIVILNLDKLKKLFQYLIFITYLLLRGFSPYNPLPQNHNVPSVLVAYEEYALDSQSYHVVPGI